MKNSDEFLGLLGFSRNDIHKVFLNIFENFEQVSCSRVSLETV